ncbi:MAG: hypothetical protein DIU62_006785 [Pseudomonadota bacterium]
MLKSNRIPGRAVLEALLCGAALAMAIVPWTSVAGGSGTGRVYAGDPEIKQPLDAVKEPT